MATADLTSQAYRHLHRRLVSGELPAGTVLSENKLAAEMGISRTPVGDAVRRLAAEGLVEQVPRYGTIVKTITLQDIEDVYELREAIEPYAARKAASRVFATQLQQLEVLCKAIDGLSAQLDAGECEELTGEMLGQFLAADLAFHMLIVHAAANTRILSVVENTRVVSQVFRIRRRRHDSAVVHAACDHHRKILAALSDGDGDRAAEWMLKHISRSKEETLALHQQAAKERVPVKSEFSLELCDDIRAELERLERHDAE